ncbi:bifunctional diguanylate cyclase/phosphodiesterase [Paenibacillus terrigena]|uniref:bifunctional diguanylate cyclase/phosphodiesterase n=1 Tax=Paenibacillus terrigena TaxID=369333 RepID=UPI0003618CEB|nr:EAL domain-containing protein [Paenibacillus terrigena]
MEKLTQTYSVALVIVSYLIAVIASYTALDLGRHVNDARGKSRLFWLIGGACSMGLGIWSMHFIAMLAMHLPIEVHYDVMKVFISIIYAIVASGIALYVVTGKRLTIGRLTIGSLFMGAGIASMHYSGMAAMDMPATIHYNKFWFVVSILMAILVSTVALLITFKLRTARSNLMGTLIKLLSGCVMGAAVAGMHYTGMYATTFVSHHDHIDHSSMSMNFTLMGYVIGIVTLIILSATLVTAYLDQVLTAKTRKVMESDERYRSLFEHNLDGVMSFTKDGGFVNMNPRATVITGEQKISFTAFLSMCRPEDVAGLERCYERTLQGEAQKCQAVMTNRHGDTLDLSITPVPVFLHEEIAGVFMIVRDITKRKQTERELQESEEKLRSVIQSATDAIIISDDRSMIISWNKGAETMFGYQEHEVLGKPLSTVIPEGFGSAHESSVERFVHTEIPKVTGATVELVGLRKDGTEFPLELSLASWKTGDQIFFTNIIRDITERKLAEQKINHMVYHDSLTGLPNRRYFEEKLQKAVATAMEEQREAFVMFLDLDGFKLVNDSLGHDFGDLLLKEVAGRILQCVEGNGVVSRLGGDEFTIILEDITEQEALHIADQIIHLIEMPILIDGHELYVTTSIGISRYPDDGADSRTLMKRADTAMYSAKEQGKNNYRIYAPAMQLVTDQKIFLQNELNRALENKELILYYQPQISMKDGSIAGMEALIRWNHPTKGIIPPDQFIAHAEETGLIVPIGEWVLRTACRQNKEWQVQGFPPMRVAVNLSARQFLKKNLVQFVENVLEETGLAPDYLELEITEGTMLDVQRSTDALEKLKKLGVHIAIDDFGTGYSSLSYLTNFPLDKLKIDQSFIRDMPTNLNNKAIVSTIISMARHLNLQVIAEGVETEEQLHFLRDEICDEVQGYLFSKPLSVEEMEQYFIRSMVEVR